DWLGLRLAGPVRGAGGPRHQFSVALHLERRGVSAVGLAVLHDGGGLLDEEKPPAVGRLPAGLRGAAARVPRVSVRRRAVRRRATGVGSDGRPSVVAASTTARAAGAAPTSRSRPSRGVAGRRADGRRAG